MRGRGGRGASHYTRTHAHRLQLIVCRDLAYAFIIDRETHVSPSMRRRQHVHKTASNQRLSDTIQIQVSHVFDHIENLLDGRCSSVIISLRSVSNDYTLANAHKFHLVTSEEPAHVFISGREAHRSPSVRSREQVSPSSGHYMLRNRLKRNHLILSRPDCDREVVAGLAHGEALISGDLLWNGGPNIVCLPIAQLPTCNTSPAKSFVICFDAATEEVVAR